MPGLAEQINPQPDQNSLAYWLTKLQAPFVDYFDRQGQMAKAGAGQANQGVEQIQGGNLPEGIPNLLLGGAGWAGSPLSALAQPLTDPVAKPVGEGLSRFIGEPIEKATGYPAGLSTQLMMAMVPGMKKGMKPVGLAETLPAAEGITAYHGSPHTFDKFDMSKIGTGEGAQAYGHGLYFAENERVAKGYRDTLSTMGADFSDPRSLTQAHLGDAGGDVGRLRENLKSDLNLPEGEIHPAARKRAQVVLDYLNTHGAPDLPGSMYQVRLNVKPDELLDWDKPLSDQPRGALTAMKDVGLAERMIPESSLGYVHGVQLMDPETVGALKNRGIKGVRYKDAGSRSGEGGTYNYVIFDDKLVDVLKRYGIPMTAGVGGSAIVAGQNLPPEVANQLEPQT